MAVYSVLMAGGAGTRFWPLSRHHFPKQLLNITGNRTLIQQCYDRMIHISESERVLIVTNSLLQRVIREQIPALSEKNFIIEPFGRNTAPCILLTALLLVARDSESVMVVVPADHLIEDEQKFFQVVRTGIEFVERHGGLVTIGIKPAYPETGYGYVQAGEVVEEIAGHAVHRVKTFAEKPDEETARRFVESGDFYWNSGMFIWKVRDILAEGDKYLPDIMLELRKAVQFYGDDRFEKTLEVAYQKIRGISIDFGVMEASSMVYMIPGDFRWNDVGSWDVVAEIGNEQRDNNTFKAVDGVAIESSNNYIHANEKVVALIGVDDLIIIDTPDALLVCRKGQSQKVKLVVDTLKLKGLEKYT